MKKKRIIALMSLCMVFAITGMVACGGNQGENSAYQIWLEAGHSGTEQDFLDWLRNSNSTSGDDSENSEESTIPALGKPVLTLNQNVAIWSEVSNANGYVYKIGASGEETQTQSPQQVTLANGEMLFVKAKGDGVTYNDSDWGSISFIRTALDEPSVVLNGNMATWGEVENATGYIYRINYGTAIEVETPVQVPLVDEQYIQVKAIGDGVLYDDSSWSDALTYFAPASDEGVLYDVSSDGTYAEVIGYEGTVKNVIIADTYNNLPVKNIYAEAFKNKNIKSIVIGNNVTSIGNSAFEGCSALESLVFPDSVTSIGNSAFKGCYQLLSVTIGKNVTTIGERAFMHCYALTSVVISDNVTTIGEEAFMYCDRLTNVVMGKAVTTIGGGAFDDCTKLTYTIYENAKYLGNEENPYLALMGVVNVNFISYQIHEDTQLIVPGVFKDCSRITSIVIPESVTSICGALFNGCDSLTVVYCEADSLPDGWYKYWCNSSIEVVWGYNKN